jgi:bisphosphoglycerate-dependent phosphoglycerate mutase
MSSVIFIRHGESLANVNPDYYKLPDVANILSEKGVQQCLALAETIGTHLDDDYHGLHTVAVASRYKRAQLTAEIVMSKTKLPSGIAIDHRINEVYHTFDVIPQEDRASVIARVRSIVEAHHFNLILFTHGVLMDMVDPGRGWVNNTELRKYDRSDLLNRILK